MSLQMHTSSSRFQQRDESCVFARKPFQHFVIPSLTYRLCGSSFPTIYHACGIMVTRQVGRSVSARACLSHSKGLLSLSVSTTSTETFQRQTHMVVFKPILSTDIMAILRATTCSSSTQAACICRSRRIFGSREINDCLYQSSSTQLLTSCMQCALKGLLCANSIYGFWREHHPWSFIGCTS